MLFFYLSILFFLIPAQPWIWWTHQEVSSNCCCLFVMKKPELDLVHMDVFLPLILHIFLREWHLKTKERSWFVIGVKAPFRWTTSVFFSSRCCHCDYVLASWSVRVEVFRSLGSRGLRSDLILVPWSWVGYGRSPVSVKLFIQLPRLKRIIVLSLVPLYNCGNIHRTISAGWSLAKSVFWKENGRVQWALGNK